MIASLLIQQILEQQDGGNGVEHEFSIYANESPELLIADIAAIDRGIDLSSLSLYGRYWSNSGPKSLEDSPHLALFCDQAEMQSAAQRILWRDGAINLGMIASASTIDKQNCLIVIENLELLETRPTDLALELAKLRNTAASRGITIYAGVSTVPGALTTSANQLTIHPAIALPDALRPIFAIAGQMISIEPGQETCKVTKVDLMTDKPLQVSI
ncbi:hypothetical protein BKN49_22375 [Pseudomonas aeruginosa]|nr:hypothetical protein BKN49_22375 [Pseudomonas aeruginosa]